MKRTVAIVALLLTVALFPVFINCKAESIMPTLAILNPGPASRPTRWNATLAKPNEIGTNSFSFYYPQTPVGSTFFINVTIKNVTNMKAWGIGIVFNNATLRYLSAWRPADHVFSYPESQGATPIAPTVSVDDYNATHKIVKWGYAYLWTDDEGNLIQWGFNGTGTLCQIQFKLIKELSPGQSVTTLLWFDPEWTSIYAFGVPSPGKIDVNMEGAYVSYSYDNTPPVIQNPQQTPATNVQPNQPVKVSVNVTDAVSGVKTVILNYTTGTTWTSINMQLNVTTGLYEATIPGFSAGTQVRYKIAAEDYAGNKAVNDNAGNYFVYTVISEIPLIVLLMALTIIGATLISAKKKKF
uniref:DUF7743 domain-containing protein n=1 Tax=Fervidobacterium pennivorans TaxID=93466 RepID=A0A7C4RXR4_FERPE